MKLKKLPGDSIKGILHTMCVYGVCVQVCTSMYTSMCRSERLTLGVTRSLMEPEAHQCN